MRIVVAVIEKNNHILITRRAFESHYGGFWELPGGKIEEHEASFSALQRELHEELNLIVEEAKLVGCVSTEAREFVIYLVTDYVGVPVLRAKQLEMAWVKRKDLTSYAFPPINHYLFEKLNACNADSDIEII